MAIANLNITEDYAALEILTQAQLNDAIQSIEDWCNAEAKLNILQIGLDVYGNTYEYNNDGLQTQASPLIELVPFLGEAETIVGAWTFANTVAFTDVATFQDVVNLTGQYKCFAHKATSDQAVTNALVQAITFNAELYDTGSMHDVGVNTERMTIPANGTGCYAFTAQVNFEGNVTGKREMYVFKNDTLFAKTIENTNVAGNNTLLALSFQDSCNGGDFYDIRVYQDSGANLNVIQGSSETFFTAVKVT